MGWNIFGGIGQALSKAYHETERGLYDLTRASETAGYEVGSLIKKGHFVPLPQAYKESGQIRENVPLLGNVSGKQFARIGASYGTQALPIVGTFGHLASHPNENVFQKASDIAFGIADVVPFGGDVISAFKKPIETGLNGVADVIRNGLRETHLPQLPIHLEPPRRIGDYVPPNVWKRVERFAKSISKDVRAITPIDRLPRVGGILDNIAKTIRGDLRVIGVAVDEDPVHILAHDEFGLLHNVAITRDGRIFHYVEDLGGVKKIGEDVLSGGEELFKTIRNEVDHVIPFHVKLGNFLRSGRLLTVLGGLGIGLSVAGGLVPQGSNTASSGTGSNTQTSTGSNVGGLGNVKVICGQGTVNGYPAVIEVNGTTYYAYGTTPADAEQGAGIQYVAEGQAPGGVAGNPFPSDPNKVYFINPDGSVKTYDLSIGQQIKALVNEQCSVVTQGQMNAGSVLQSQLQTLSASMPSTTPESQPAGQAVFEPSLAPEPSVSETSTSPATPVESQPVRTTIFSNKTVLIGIAVVMIIIIAMVV